MLNRREFLALPVVLQSAPSSLRVLLLGDSLTAQCWQMINSPRLSLDGGRLLIHADGHAQWPGASIRLTGLEAADGDHAIVETTRDLMAIAYSGPLPRIVNTSTVLLKSNYSSASYWLWLNGMAGGGLELVDCMGIVGATSAEILVRADAALKSRPDIVVDLSYFNDLGRVSKENMLKNRQLLAEKSLVAGARHIHVSALPLHREGPKTKPESMATLRWINAALRQSCDGKRTLFADAWARCIHGDGFARNAVVASDRVHLSQVGAYQIAAAIWDELAPKSALSPAAPEMRTVRLSDARYRQKLAVRKGQWNAVKLPIAISDASSLVSVYARIVMRTEQKELHAYVGTPGRAAAPVSAFGSRSLRLTLSSSDFFVPPDTREAFLELVLEGGGATEVRVGDPILVGLRA